MHATQSPRISSIPANTSGARMSISVKKGSASIKPIEISEILPDILDAISLYSSPRPSFSSAHLRNEAVVPLEKALSARAIQTPPSVKTRKPSAIR